MDFEVVQGDITKQKADALVSAADTDIEMGGGVAGKLRKVAGQDIHKEANEKSPIGLGDAVETGAYDLDAEYVVHAATMETGSGADESTVRDSTRNALTRADELGCESFVLPALGCGVAGVDIENGAYYIFEEILEYEPTNLTDVRVIGYSDDEYETLRRVANGLSHR
jgi:O-acetyl-ADP-ribose deacetylase (regulator of RNase III)